MKHNYELYKSEAVHGDGIGSTNPTVALHIQLNSFTAGLPLN